MLSPNTGKYRPEITPYLDTFHALKVIDLTKLIFCITKTHPRFTYSKWAMEIPKHCQKICSKKAKNTLEHVIDVILMPLLLTLSRFHTLIWCFHGCLWTSKYQLGRYESFNLVKGWKICTVKSKSKLHISWRNKSLSSIDLVQFLLQ